MCLHDGTANLHRVRQQEGIAALNLMQHEYVLDCVSDAFVWMHFLTEQVPAHSTMTLLFIAMT